MKYEFLYKKKIVFYIFNCPVVKAFYLLGLSDLSTCIGVAQPWKFMIVHRLFYERSSAEIPPRTIETLRYICVKYNARKKILLSIFPINLNHFQLDYKSNQIIFDIL